MVALRFLMGPIAFLISRAEIGDLSAPPSPVGGQGFGGPGGAQGYPGASGAPPGFDGPGGPGGPGFGGQDSPGFGGPGGPGFGGGPGGPGGQGFGGPGLGGPGLGGPGYGGPNGPQGNPGGSQGFGGPPPGFGGPGGPGFGEGPGGSAGGQGFGSPGAGGSGFDGPGGPGGPGFAGDGGPGFNGPGGPGGPGGGGGPFGGEASCPNCNFNASVLEDFTQDFTFVSVQGSILDTTTTTLRHATGDTIEAHGTIALNVRHMQSQLTLHGVRHHPHGTADWDILVNGVSHTASLHISSPRLNACVSANLPPVHAPEDQQLQMVEQMAPMMVQQSGHHGTLDGDGVVVLSQPIPPWESPDTYDGVAVDFNDQSSHLALLRFPRSHQTEHALAPASNHSITQLGVKFSNYRPSTNFVDVGCTIAGQAAAQELLSDPEVRAHFEGRLRQLEQHAVALRSIAPVAHVFAAIPTNLVDIFLPESSAMSDMDMLEAAHSNGNVHSWVLTSLIMGLTAAVGGVLLHKALRGEQEVDMYENLEA